MAGLAAGVGLVAGLPKNLPPHWGGSPGGSTDHNSMPVAGFAGFPQESSQREKVSGEECSLEREHKWEKPANLPLNSAECAVNEPVENCESGCRFENEPVTHLQPLSPTTSDPSTTTSVEREGCAREQAREDDGAATVE